MDSATRLFMQEAHGYRICRQRLHLCRSSLTLPMSSCQKVIGTRDMPLQTCLALRNVPWKTFETLQRNSRMRGSHVSTPQSPLFPD
jgi:hypothetical protein